MGSVKCYLCGKYGRTEVHHIFEGRNRKNSDKYGATISICRNCHEAIHHHPAEWMWLKKQWQVILMDRNGWTEDEFREVFRRSYL